MKTRLSFTTVMLAAALLYCLGTNAQEDRPIIEQEDIHNIASIDYGMNGNTAHLVVNGVRRDHQSLIITVVITGKEDNIYFEITPDQSKEFGSLLQRAIDTKPDFIEDEYESRVTTVRLMASIVLRFEHMKDGRRTVGFSQVSSSGHLNQVVGIHGNTNVDPTTAVSDMHSIASCFIAASIWCSRQRSKNSTFPSK